MFSNYLVAIYEGYTTNSKYPLADIKEAFKRGLIKIKGDTRQGVTQELIDKAKIEVMFLPDLSYSKKQKEDLLKYVFNNLGKINDTGNKQENISDIKSVLNKIPVDDIDRHLQLDWDRMKQEVVGAIDLDTKYDQLFVKWKSEGANIIEVESTKYTVYDFAGTKKETIAAVNDFACNSGWCLTDKGYAEDYLRRGGIYMVIKGNKRVAAINIETGSFMDVYDKPIKVELGKDIVQSTPTLRKDLLRGFGGGADVSDKRISKYIGKLTSAEEDEYITDMFDAIALGSTKKIDEYIKKGAGKHYKIFDIAAEHGQTDVAKWLLDNDRNPSKEDLSFIAEKFIDEGDEELMMKFWDNPTFQKDMETGEYGSDGDGGNWTADDLFISGLKNGMMDFVKIIESKYKIGKRTKGHALWQSALNGSVKSVKFLLEKDDAFYPQAFTKAVEQSIMDNQTETFKLLFEDDRSIKDEKNLQEALNFTINHAADKILKILLKHIAPKPHHVIRAANNLWDEQDKRVLYTLMDDERIDMNEVKELFKDTGITITGVVKKHPRWPA